MLVFKLEIDCAKCYWIGMALVAAMSYEDAISEYINHSEIGEFVKSGEIVFTHDSKQPINGLAYNSTKIICDVVTFDV